MSVNNITRLFLFSILIITVLAFSFEPEIPQSGFRFPYREEGLSDRQAAAHLLSRFTFGPAPGDVDAVVNMGLENWFSAQLKGGLSDGDLESMLSGYGALKMSNAEIVRNFPKPIQVFRMAKAEGLIADDTLNSRDKVKSKEMLAEFYKRKGFRQQSELYREFINAKIYRAAYSKNQLHEVLADFWFNHFNVSLTKRSCALFIPNYERDAIRPFVTGRFGDMLLATAKSPAMLIYLDNFNSAANNDEFDENKRLARKLKDLNERVAAGDTAAKRALKILEQRQSNKGLNENYAREVMELHTLGVDGGYTQQDVTEAARVLTGWTIYPMEDGLGNAYRKIIETIGEENLADRGFVHDGDFFFAMNRHDNKSKTVLGKRFPGNDGYQEGVTLLSMLARHPSTAAFISRKLAVRFVSDDPPAALVEKMAKSFIEHDGDISEVLKTMVCSREFWSRSTLRSKTKSPFELVISAIRALQAKVIAPFQVYRAADRMGQKLYNYAPPTGFPDKAAYWINSGALLNRMNFGMALAGQQARGISCNLLALNQNHEPESATDALLTYSRLLLPERDLGPTIKRLTPLLTEPDYADRLNAEAGKTRKKEVESEDDELAMLFRGEEEDDRKRTGRMEGQTQQMLAQVVGIILGSPEFQRR